MAFLAFEGLDGSGKSTLIRGLADHLVSQGQEFIITREPGGTALGDEIRQWLLRTEGDIPTPRAELLLYQAGRAQHVERKILPAIQEKKWVLCDRYTASSLAFQAGGRGLSRSEIEWLNRFATRGCEPDLWILLDVPVTEGMARIHSRSQDGGAMKDRFEQEDLSFHERVREFYLRLASEQAERWLVLDGRNSPAELLKSLLENLRSRGWLQS